jgi:ABC-type phosphate/phosphonate transport system substrate-binding protein
MQRKEMNTMFAAMIPPRVLLLFAAIVLVLPVAPVCALEFKIGIMQDRKGSAEQFAPLEKYLKEFGIEVKMVEAASYPIAARMFAAGEVDGMFSGAGIGGSMIIKGVAYPLVRPVSEQGYSTYWAVVLAPKGAPEFSAEADYFRGKRVIYCAMASTGEFFFRSIRGANREANIIFTTRSHGEAISALAEGKADIAIVKNWVWERVKRDYPHIEQVGSDSGQNPDGTLMVSHRADRKTTEKVAQALIALEQNEGPAAVEVRDKLGISGYTPTSITDFRHTLNLLHGSGVETNFDFAF